MNVSNDLLWALFGWMTTGWGCFSHWWFRVNVIKKKVITNVFYNVFHNQLQCAASTQKGLCL